MITVCLGVLLHVCANVQILLGVIAEVQLGACLCALIQAVVVLVPGLVLQLVPLCLGLAGVLVSLNLNVVAQVLAIL